MSLQSSGKSQKVSYCDIIFLGRNRLWLRQKGFRVVTGCGQDKGALCYDKAVCIVTELG